MSSRAHPGSLRAERVAKRGLKLLLPFTWGNTTKANEQSVDYLCAHRDRRHGHPGHATAHGVCPNEWQCCAAGRMALGAHPWSSEAVPSPCETRERAGSAHPDLCRGIQGKEDGVSSRFPGSAWSSKQFALMFWAPMT